MFNRLPLLLFFSLLLCFHSLSFSAEDTDRAYKIRAGYLYNFTKFITWPETPGSQFNICISGDNPFNNLLQALQNRTALHRPIAVHFFATPDSANVHCHILYLGHSHLDPRLRQSLPQGTLLVSESADNAEYSMITFNQEQQKIRLYINLNASQQAGLTISAKLLEVATLTGGKP